MSVEGKLSSKREAIIRVFRRALRARIRYDTTYEGFAMKDRMQAPLCEWGYTINHDRREKQHQTYSSSNWLMCMTEAFCRERWGDKYRIKFFNVYNVPLLALASYAEAFITVIGQGYVVNGGGFSHHPAGRSVGGSMSDQDQNEEY